MQLPELLKRLKPETIYFDSRFPCEGDSCDGLETFLYISVNPILCPSEYEQALTLLHEMLHSHEEFDNKSTFANHDNKIEAEIDAMAKKILAEQPETFHFLVQQIREAKAIAIRKSIEPAPLKPKIYLDLIGGITMISRWKKIKR